VLVMPCGCISLPVTFGTTKIFRTESVLFDVAEVSLLFNAILDRPTLYQFMAVAHYRYLVLKMPSPNGVLKIRGDRDAGACALEKLQALAVACEAAAEPGAKTRTTELTLAWLDLRTPCATLCQGGHPREDHPDRSRSCSDYPCLR
jgi:hypothetical protein